MANDFDSFQQGLAEIKTDVIVKTAEFGYDGKGQLRLGNNLEIDEIKDAWAKFEGGRVVIEECIPLEAELSVLVARGTNGDATTWDPVENIHRNHILDLSILPARLPEKIQAQAKEVALAISETLQYVGVLAVEFFLAKDGRLVVNELAPRPHNSGHHTIDACETSQFEQQGPELFSIFPPWKHTAYFPTVMMNLLGDVWIDPDTPPDWSTLLKTPGTSLHLYGKREARKGRKMGHLTSLATDREEALERISQIRQSLDLPTL